MNTYAEIFTYADAAPLSQDDEVATIAAAQAGDEEAALRLVVAYGPALRAAVSRFKGNTRDGQRSQAHSVDGTSSGALEDVQSTALVAFFETLAEHDPTKNPRLAGRLGARLNRALADEATAGATFAIPERTLSRFYGILRAADGDVDRALALAPEYAMTRDTFLSILAAVSSESLDATLDDEARDRIEGATSVFTDAEVADAEDALLVEIAFTAVDDEEARICELAYGFRGTEDYAPGEPVPDEAIAAVVGTSRPTVQRKRGKALDKMRKALAVTLEA